MRQKNEKLKVYEFLYNRLPFSDDESEEYEAMQRMDLLEEHFDLYFFVCQNKLDSLPTSM